VFVYIDKVSNKQALIEFRSTSSRPDAKDALAFKTENPRLSRPWLARRRAVFTPFL
jgi:hypothetical protein